MPLIILIILLVLAIALGAPGWLVGIIAVLVALPLFFMLILGAIAVHAVKGRRLF